jgi:hypothetical protein
LKKKGDSTLNYFLIIFLTALEVAHGEFPKWRAGSDVGGTKKRISLQNTCLQFHLRALARNTLPHCAHDTKLHRLQIQKNHTKLAGYGQQKTTLPRPNRIPNKPPSSVASVKRVGMMYCSKSKSFGDSAGSASSSFMVIRNIRGELLKTALLTIFSIPLRLDPLIRRI